MIELASYLIRMLGVPLLIHRLIARRRVGVLLYHDPDPTVFDAHLSYLCRRYNLIPFSRVTKAIDTGDWSSIPPYAISVHIDDGYRRNIELLETCRRLGVTPTLYLCSHVICTRRQFWSKLKGGRSKRLRLVDNDRLLAKLLKEADYTPETEYPERQALNAAELAEMAPQFEFQSHGRYHFSFITMDDAGLAEELTTSRERIKVLTGSECEHVSYPYGDFSAREIEAAENAGYRSGRTTRPGWIGPGIDPFRLPIVADVPGSASVNELRLHLTGIPRLVKRTIYVMLTKYVYAARQRFLMSRRYFCDSGRSAPDS